jgi:hypothetical protein
MAMAMAMTIEVRGIPATVLMKRSGVSFYTRRVLQRWLRGEITTDPAIELIQTQDAERIIGAWCEAARRREQGTMLRPAG